MLIILELLIKNNILMLHQLDNLWMEHIILKKKIVGKSIFNWYYIYYLCNIMIA